MNFLELKEFLDLKVAQYNTKDFIDSDPIQIPHLFTQKQDIEIAGFLSATIAWGNRKIIVKNAHRLLDLFGESPYDFVMESKKKQQQPTLNNKIIIGGRVNWFHSPINWVKKCKGLCIILQTMKLPV